MSEMTGPPALHAPWRTSYMELLARAGDSAGTSEAPGVQKQAAKKETCFLRGYWLSPEADEANRVIVRTGNAETGRGGMILLNAYPYSNGHLLVVLGTGRMRLMEYTPEERSELWSLVDLAVELCERTLMPQGVNVGVNQGDAAGAGVPEHLHVHVVPRWHGDTNFITAVGQVRVIPCAIDDMWRRYRDTWTELRDEQGLGEG